MGATRFAPHRSPLVERRSRRIWISWAAALILPCISAAIAAYSPLLQRISFALFLASIAVTAWLSYAWPTAVVIVLSAVLYNYFIAWPRGHWSLQPDELSREAVAMGVAAVIGVLILRMRKTGAALAISEAFYRTRLASIGDAVIATDVDGAVTFMNAVGESITGWTETEAIDRPLASVFRISNEDTGEPIENPVDTVRRQKTVVGMADGTRLERRDGSFVPINDSAAPVRTADGQNVGVVPVFRDVTSRRQAERERQLLLQRAQAAETELRAAVALYKDQVTALTLAQQAGRSAAWIYDVVRQEVKWLPGGFEIFGRPFEELTVPQSSFSLLEAEDRPGVQAVFLRTIETGAPFQHEFRVHWPDDEIHWLEARGMRDPEDSNYVRGTTSDVTERKHVELALLRTEKLAAVGRIASTIAHEINNPLSSVTNLLYLALLDQPLNEQTRSYLLTAQAELSRLVNVTRLTLSYTRLQSDAKDINPSEVIDSVIQLLRIPIESKGIDVIRVCPEPVLVHLLVDELQRILTNLVANAIDAVDGSGGILRIALERRGLEALLSVEDNGSGIPPDLIGRIFDPFYTTKEEVGTGIGLWVTKELVEKNGGSITVLSGSLDYGMRTRFQLRFPAVISAPA